MSTASDGRLRFEEIAVGMAWDTPGITVTEGHILAFAGLSGDFYDIHVDDDYARSLGYPGRIAHGLLGLALADGLKNRATTRVISGTAGLNYWHGPFVRLSVNYVLNAWSGNSEVSHALQSSGRLQHEVLLRAALNL